MNVSPGLIAMYATLAWIVLSVPAGILIGRALRAADTHTTSRCRTLGCPCGTC